MDGITLVLHRRSDDLWIETDTQIACIWDVTGLERVKDSAHNHVRILQNGRQIGSLWEVKEIKEKR